MNELNFIWARWSGREVQCGRLSLAIRPNDIEGELALWFGQGLPCLTDVVSLLFGGELAG